MSLEKLDRRLIEEIRVRKEASKLEGKTLEEITQEQYKVTLELEEPLAIPSNMTREEALQKMELSAERAQAGVVEALSTLGVEDFERQILSNSIVVTLTLDQIQELASRDDIKIVRLVKIEKLIP